MNKNKTNDEEETKAMNRFFRRMALFAAAGAMAMSMSTMTACDSASSNDGKGTFTIAYLPDEASETKANARKGFGDELSALIGMKVQEFSAADYSAIVEAMRAGHVDMAYFGPLSFCQAYERSQAEPIGMAAMHGNKEAAFYQSHFIVKSDSDIQSLADFEGRTIAFVDPSSTSGNLVPTYELMKAFADRNFGPDDFHTNGKFFSAASYSGKHQAGLQAVVKGDVDIVPIASSTLANEIIAGEVAADAVRIVHTSFDVPNSPMAVRGGLPQDIKDKIRTFLLSYDNADYFEGVLGNKDFRFVHCTIDDYKSIIELDKMVNN